CTLPPHAMRGIALARCAPISQGRIAARSQFATSDSERPGPRHLAPCGPSPFITRRGGWFTMDARRAPRGRSRRAMQDIARMLVPVLLLAGVSAVRFVSPAHAQTTALDSTATLLWTAPGD